MKKLFASLFLILTLGFNTYSQTFEPNELLVQVQSDDDARLVANKLIEAGQMDLVFFKLISVPMRIYHLKYSGQVNLDEIIKKSHSIQQITGIQKNHLVEDRVTIPNDTEFGDQWHLNNTGQTGGIVDADIDAPEAWDITTGGNTAHGDTIVVCIIESQGVDINHPDLAGNMWKNYADIPGNGIDDDNNGYIDDFDGWNVGNNTGNITAGSHGTRVAGMIGAIGNNAQGISGVNHQVKMMVVQGQSASNEASVIAAYTYPLIMRQKYNATNGADGAFVVATNASWGINNGQPANAPLWCNFYDTLGLAGILNIGATSNSNVNVDVVGDLPTACPSEYMLAVTMTNSADTRAGSGYGPIHIDIAAPGSSVRLTNSNNTYTTTTGTSFATPCVAGAVALLYSAPCADFISYAKTFPDSGALKIRELLMDNVDLISNLTAEVGSGGRTNLHTSVEALMNSCDTNSCITPYGISLSNITDTEAFVQWQTNNTSEIDLYYGISGSPLNTQIIVNISNPNTSYPIIGLTPCTAYDVTIQGICMNDSSNFSPTLTFVTDGCCTNPELVIDNSTESTLDLSWSPVLYATNYVIRHQIVGSSSWIYDTVNATNYQILNLDTCTEYAVQIQTICSDSSDTFSPAYVYTTKGCGICYEGDYCEIIPAAISTQFEWIESFTINGITQTTGDNDGYLDGGIFGNGFLPGAAYNISFTPGYAGTAFTERFKLWIDMDQNGVFDASDELISNISNNGPVSGMLFIPNTTINGITKMRIAMNGTGAPTLCADEGGNIYGEYEDYCVFIGDNSSVSEYDKQKPLLFPNPTNGVVNIGNTNEAVDIKVYDLTGKLVLNLPNIQSNQFSIDQFETGIYMVEIKVNNHVYQQKMVKD